MPSLYPGAYDDIPDVNDGDLISAAHENSVVDAVNQIEQTLGLEPAGGFTTVGEAVSAANAGASVALAQNFV